MRLVGQLTAILLALCVAHTLAKCPEPTGDLKLKQSQIQKIVEHLNRPYLPDPDDSKIDTFESKWISNLPSHEVFSLFDERQWPEVEVILTKMMEAKTFQEFIDISDAIRHKVNDDLFLFAFTSAIVHRPDTQGLNAPRVQDVYPDKFFTQDVITKIKECVNQGDKHAIVNDTHDYWNNMDINHRLSYFTEDMGMNSHHYHWHTVNPAIWTPKLGGVKDRRGESFYWMHRQMLARYDAERLSNRLPRVNPFENWHYEIEDGYASHLSIDSTGYQYMFRPDYLRLKNLPELSINELKLYRSRILDSIHKGYVYAKNGTKIYLRDDPFGIDLIGHLVESSRQTVNRLYYGNLHCYAHVLAARIADPDNKYMLDNGVMYDVATSARDPLFYQWHKFIDNVFQEYKDTLPIYTPEQVNWADIKIEKVTMKGETSKVDNKLSTFWDTSVFKIGKHFSYTAQSTAEIKVQHLQHEPFSYDFEITNNAGDSKEAMIRAYLVPKYNEQGKPFKCNEQRSLMIELDKFITKLKPGKNTIHRTAEESSVTASEKQIFAPFDTIDTKDQCNCGWPSYMLLPKGKPEGMKFTLVVFITNWGEDKLHDDHSCMCKGAPSYCRFLYNMIPDRRPVGYPFDRRIDSTKWKDIQIDNLYTTDVTITFTGDDKL